jgi:hypothetical protein
MVHVCIRGPENHRIWQFLVLNCPFFLRLSLLEPESCIIYKSVISNMAMEHFPIQIHVPQGQLFVNYKIWKYGNDKLLLIHALRLNKTSGPQSDHEWPIPVCCFSKWLDVRFHVSLLVDYAKLWGLSLHCIYHDYHYYHTIIWIIIIWIVRIIIW